MVLSSHMTYVHHVNWCDVWQDRGTYSVLVARLLNEEAKERPGKHILVSAH